MKMAAALGNDLSEEDGAKVYEAFCRIAANKQTVGEKELDAIIVSAALQVPPTYRLESYVINTGNTISASAQMKLTKNGQTLSGVSLGDGPVDAVFNAIHEVVPHTAILRLFQVHAVTEGTDAQAQVSVRLEEDGRIVARGAVADFTAQGTRSLEDAFFSVTA